MGIGTCNLQYHIWMVIRNMKQSCRLPFQIGQTTKQYCSHSHVAHSHKFRWTSIQYTKSNITTMPNSQGHQTFKHPVHHRSCYIWFNHSGKHTRYYMKPLTSERHEALLQMQRMDPFCKCISKRLSNGKAQQHEADLFIHIEGLLYKHITHAHQKFLALVIPKAWKYKSFSRSTCQTWTPRSKSHLLSHQVEILLERNEQEYLEICS